MMERLFLVIGLHLLIISVFIGPAQAHNRREDLIQDSLRRLLGVKPDIDRATSSGKNITSLLPRYVMDLYEKYRSGHTPMQGNTVRSILPMRDTIGDADMLIFNLTGVKSSERILQSKLYILKRRRPKPGKKRGSSHFRIKIGTLPHMTSHRFVELSLTRHKSEWHSYDITESVVQCRQQHSKNGDYLLGVTLEVKRSKGSYRLSPFRRLLKHDSQPFLLIFAEDGNNNSRNALKANTRTTNSGIKNILQTQIKRDGLSPVDLSEDSAFSDERAFQDRQKRSIYQPIAFSSNSSKRLPQKVRPRKSSSRPSLNLRIFHDLSTLQTNINMDIINNQNFLFKQLRWLSDIFVNLLRPLGVNKLKGFTFYNSSNVYEEPAATEIFSTVLDKDGNSSEELPALQSGDFFEKVLLQNLDWSIENYSAHGNVSKRTVQRDVHEATVFTQRSRSKRSVPGTSVTSKEPIDSVTVTNTFQTLGKRYGNRLNSSARSSARRRSRLRSQSSKKPKKKRRRNPKLPFWWTKHNNRLHSQDYGTLCQRKSLVVDFVKLGWGDWVMSPKSFNAHYCSGGCSFPLIKNANPSNHAAIQSLVHAIGLSPNVPTPCCVPSASSPLTLLYFDEHGNLVLKNYPNMIVEKCACR